MERSGAIDGGAAAATSQKRIAVLTVALSGHMRPALALAGEMAGRGFVVDLLVGARGLKAGMLSDLHALERAWPRLTVHRLIQGKDFATGMDWQCVARSSGGLGGSVLALMEMLAGITGDPATMAAAVQLWQAMIALVDSLRPDVVVTDHSQKLVQLWAEEHCYPTIIMHTPYFTTGTPAGCAQIEPDQQYQLQRFMQQRNPFAALEDAKAALGISEAAVISMGEGAAGAREAKGLSPHTLVFCEPELLHDSSLPGRVHAVGPCLGPDACGVDEHVLPWLDAAVTKGEQVLYVALGTLGNGFLTATAVGVLMDACAALGEDWRVLWSLPKAQQPLLQEAGRAPLGERLRVEDFVRQRAVLGHPAVRAFLTHGGQSSVNEGLSAGVPLVCMPLFCDQFEVAQAVASHGLGLVFHKHELLSGASERLAALLQRVDEEPLIRRTVMRYAELMRIREGCTRAGDVVESIACSGADFQELWRGRPAEAPAHSAVLSEAPVRPAVYSLTGCLQGLARTWGQRHTARRVPPEQPKEDAGAAAAVAKGEKSSRRSPAVAKGGA